MRAGGDGAARPATAPEVDRDERKAVGAPARGRSGSEGADQAGERPAVGGNKRMVAAAVGEPGRAGDPAAERAGEGAAGVDFAAGSATSAASPTCSTLAEPLSLPLPRMARG
jgi:hypothetical protein